MSGEGKFIDGLMVGDGLFGKDVTVAGDVTVGGAILSNLVDCTASTLTVTAAAHAGKVVTLNRAAGIAVTLPAATGTGNKYHFIVGTTVTSNAITIKSSVGTDVWAGLALGLDGDGVPANAWAAAGTTDGINLDGSTQGGVTGDEVVLIDISPTMWAVQVRIQQSGTEATPFTDTVS